MNLIRIKHKHGIRLPAGARKILSGLVGLLAVFSGYAQQLAFPGAQGFGQYATGGRGGTVYHVTTLADSGAGSFRDAVSAANRTIVFDVGGYIVLNSAISCSSGLTIAGQTAPGGGIGIMGHEVSFSAKNNEIVRFLRIRPGSLASSTEDGINCGDGVNMIFDHISIEFSPYNNIDSTGSSGANTITLQNSILGDPIGQQFNQHAEALSKTFSWCYNIFASAHNRNPMAKVNAVFINNTIYNYQGGYTVADTSSHFSHDIVNNYFITGPSTTSAGDDFYQMDGNIQAYSTGNLLDQNRDGSLNGSATAPGSVVVLAAPWSTVTTNTPTYSTATAYKYDVSLSGALPRDQVDQSVLGDVTSLGASGRMWTTQTSTGLGNNGYGTIDGGTALVDSDQDGMPDIWENATGSNPTVADNNTVAADGYTLLEHYLNWLAAPHAFVQTNATDIDLWPYTLGFTNGATYTVFNFTNGTATITNGHFAHFLPTITSAGLASFNFKVVDSAGSSMTNTMGLLVSVIYIPKNLVWRGDGVNNIWDTTNTIDWFNGNDLVTFNSSDNVTFDDTGSASTAININSTVAPGSLVFNASQQDYTIGGTGAVSGTASLTKSGTDNLFVNNANSFTGNVNLNSGTIQLNNGGTIGAGSIIFQNGSLINNWASGTQPGFSNPIIVTNNGTANISLGNRIALSGNISGTGTLNITAQSTVSRDDLNGNATGFTGTVNFLGNGSMRGRANGGYFVGFPNAVTVMNSPVSLGFYDTSTGNTFSFGALSGTNANTVLYLSYAGAPTLNIGSLNLDSTFAGQFQNSINLIKVGTGTLTLSGVSTHTGTTTVSAGSLSVTGSFSNSPVTVVSGANLRGSGFLGGGVTVQSGGNVFPGIANGQAGTLTVSNGLTLAAPNLYFDLSSSPSGANDQIVMQGGSLAMSGVNNYIFYPINGFYGAGTYDLIEGATTSTAWSGVTQNLPTNTRQTFNLFRASAGSNPSYVRLTVTGNAGSLVWQGTNGSNWDLATTNWLNGSVADQFYNLDLVQFDDTSTNGNVNLVGTLQPATVLVTNNLLNYTIGGGVLAGFTSLTKNGSGTLTLNSSNSFSGGTIVNGGILQFINNYYAGGAGAISLNGGTLYLNGVGTGTTISCAGTNTLEAANQPYAGFNLQGSGLLNVTLNNPGVFSPSGDWSGFSGTLYFTTGNWLRELNTVTFGSSNAVWNLGPAGGLYNKYGGATISLGAVFGGTGAGLSGATTANASTTTFVIGGVNTNSVFNGVISDGGAANTALIFNGPGSLTLTGNNPFTGGITVNAGTLTVNNTAGSGTGSGVVTINRGATLAGTGVIGGIVSIAAGGILAPGGSSAGTLTISNDLSLDNASVIQFQLGTSNDQVTVIGNLTLGGTLNISAATGFGPGTYTLFTYGDALSVGTITLGTAPAGYGYSIDTSAQGAVNLIVTLPQFGKIISTPNGIVMSGSGGPANANYYLQSSTNLALPLANWTRVATNQFDANGNFNFTNVLNLNLPQLFYRLQLP